MGHLIKLKLNDFIVFELSNNRYLQFARVVMRGFEDQVLWGETSGALEDGGTADLDFEQQQQILDLGWSPPDGLSEFPNYQMVWQRDDGKAWIKKSDAKDAADVACQTLRGPLRVMSPGRVTVTEGHM